jgi:hypothetical protein
MIVTMRPGIKPRCTLHRTAMKLYQFGEPTGLMMKAYKCDEGGCTRAYNSSQGYFDIVNDRVVLLAKEQQDCHSCELPMYLDVVNPDGTETWRCAQIGCNDAAQLMQDPVDPTQR